MPPSVRRALRNPKVRARQGGSAEPGAKSANVKAEAKAAGGRKTQKGKGSQLDRRLAASKRYAAITEILKVMSDSPGDVQPVLAAVAERAAVLCDSPFARVMLVERDVLRAVAAHSTDGSFQPGTLPIPLKRTTVTGRAMLDRTIIHHDDIDPLLNTEYPDAVNMRRLGARAVLAVPLIHQRTAYGAILLFRREPRPFSSDRVALVETFAQQAAIAIDNVRLFDETKEALEQQRASSEVLTAISSSISDTKPVFDVILQSCQRLFTGETVGITLLREDGMLDVDANVGRGLDQLGKAMAFPHPLGRDTASGTAILDRRVLIYPDINDGTMPAKSRDGALAIGTHSMIVAPMIFEGRAIGTLWIGRSFKGPFPGTQIALLKTFADQAVIAIQNARLFREIEDKSRQLETASRHKSEFLANMSHELRTPLNAIIGFSEVLAERMFGEINDKQAEYLADILESGRHLLSLINDILDLSKIEAGRMELEPTEFNLPDAIENTLTLVRERAHRHGIALGRMVDERLGTICADERKVKQVLLNLLSNALKFTPEGGRIDVAATVTDNAIEISVSDTGVGIAAEDQAAVFEEFRQVGAASKKIEGTGLGLAISRKFIELHGGKIWVKSQVGAGSTFAFTLPLQ